MTLDELIKQKKKEKAQQELNKIVQSKLETNKNQESSATNRRKAYTPTESTKAIDRSINTSKVSLPLANEFKNQLETGKRVQPTKEQSLPVFVNKIKQEALPMIGKSVAQDMPRVVGNAGYGLANGLIDFNSRLERATIAEFKDKYNSEFQELYNNKDANIIDELHKIAEKRGDTYENVEGLWKAYYNEQNGGDSLTKTLKKQKEINNQKIQENITNTNNIITNKLSQLTPSMGQMLPSMVPIIGVAYSIGSAQQAYYEEAKERGMDEKDANNYGNIMGLLEGGADYIGGKLTKGVGKHILKGSGKQAGKSFLLNVAENVGEEAVMEPLSELTTKITGGDKFLKNDYRTAEGWKQLLTDMYNSGINGGLTSIIMGGASAGIGSSINIVNKISNGKRVSINEINTARKDVQNRLSDTGVQQEIQKAQNLVNNIQNEQNNNTRQAINQQENKLAQNGTSAQLNDILNNKNLPIQNYKYEKSNNIKIDNLRQDANRYFNNSEQAKNYVNMLEKIITDKDIDIRLDGNLKTADGRIANGSYSNGVITINPNSTRAGEFIAVHELTHAIGTKDMLNIVNNYRKSNVEFDTAVNSLLQNYNETEITEEALSDIAGQVFGNQEFINNLSKSNPNIFQRIYNEIKYLWHQFRGYKNQDQFVDDLYYKWTQAYNSDKINNQKSSYSIQQDNNGNKYVRVDTDQDIFEGIPIYEQTKIAKKYILDKFRESGLDYENGNAKVTSKTANEYTHPKKQLPYQTKQSKIKASTELDNILNISNYEYSANDDGRHPFAKDGWDYYRTVFEVDGIKFEGLVNIAKSGNKRTFYDITNIKRISQNRSTSDNSFSTSLTNSNNNILPTKEKVNSNTKYFIQESENNSRIQISNENKKRLEELKSIDTSNMTLLPRKQIEHEIKALENGFNSYTEYSEYEEKLIEKRINERQRKKQHNETKQEDNDYRLSHRPTETGALASNISDNGLIPSDVYEHPEWYFSMSEKSYQESFNVLKKIRNKPDAEIKIYRASTKNELNVGDWVTLSKTYAKEHNERSLNFKGKVYEYTVKEKDIQYAGDDINEFGYYPAEKYSQNNKDWQSYLDENYTLTGTRTNLKDILPTREYFEGKSSSKQNISPLAEQNSQNTRKVLNPTEISNLTYEDANTTPKLPNRNYVQGNKESSFLSNITTDAGFLNEDLRQEMAKEDNIRYYKGITNEQTLEKAYTDLQKGGQKETINWFTKDNKNVNAEDVAKGWILLKQYQDAGDYQSAVEVAKKMRDIGTTAGQTVQAYNILSRLTPEGMFYYAQSELTEAYNKLVDGKSKEWIDKYKNEFELTPEDTQFIRDTMQEVSTMEDGYDKKLKLAEIQKLITDKIPSNAGKSIKAWMRISMLFNPKTQIRNVAGNAVILPVNMFSDSVSAGIDRLISKTTGVRTTGNTNIKSYVKGFGKGLYESYSDFRHGVNTRDIAGNRFEIGDGKSFSDKNAMGRNLNRVDNILSFMLDAGDRGFYEATFTNSINNQLVLNNTTEVTQDMIDIATKEALQRTWQDNNAYTQTVLTIRNALNGKVGKHKGMNYGVGDVLIPFAKTPANLTKAIVDYSPVGLVKTLASDAIKLKNSLKNGQYTPQLQHKFVQNLGKATAGSFLYVLGYALAQAGVITGEADEDKDIKNFMKNSLGISSYSIKIGDKTFTYDWAQPIAAPLAFMANFTQKQKDNPEMNLFDTIGTVINTGTDLLFEQSFMESINTVLNGSGSVWENFVQSVLDLPARAIPTFSKQIADMVDTTQRTSFEYDKPVESAINSVVAKIPFASKTLPPSVDTLGNEIKKYGGDNGIWNVMFNPANTNKGELSKAGKEIYDVYMQTGDITIFPRTAPYYINNKGEKINMDSSQRTEFQKVTGTYVENTLEGLLNNKDYTKLSNEEKTKVITEIVSDSYSKAKYDVLKIDSKEYQKLRNTLKNVSTTSYYDYKFKTEDIKKDKDKIGVLVKSNYSNKEKQTLYENYIKSENDLEYSTMKAAKTDINQYLKYKQQEFSSDKKDDGTLSGKSVSGSKQKKVVNYLNSMDITGNQRLLLYAMQGYTTTASQKTQLINYVQELKLNKEDKLKLYDKFSGFKVYKDGTVNW